MTAPLLINPADPGEQALEGMKVTTFALNSGFGIQPNKYSKDNGALVMEGVAVFRTGTFADSMGRENTWEAMHLNQMVTNWDHLRGNKTFEHVPVRDGHPGWIVNGQKGNGKVVGWHTNVRVEEMESPTDGVKYHYLIADYEILDEDAKRDINSGLWRNRSSEIGTYLTNNQAEHWPVYMGVAYVDIPAVEGLNFSASQAGGFTPRVYVMFDNNKEKNVGDNPSAAPAQGGTPEAAPAASTSQHAAPAAPAQPFKFSVNGSETTDFAAVQAHITSLEAFRTETTKTNRENFVTALGAANKIPATQLDKFKAHVGSMTTEQFTAFQELYGDMEVPALLAQHATPASNEGGSSPAQHTAAQGQATEITILRERVAMHKGAGASKATIEKTESYKRLVALDPSYTL
jgi:hypothetical protein